MFNHITIDGFFTDPNGDMSFAHRHDAANDPEWQAFTNENAGGGGALVFGRVTYDMMVRYWPTEQAKQAMPKVASKMNDAPKIVFSKSMKDATWNNTTLIHDDPAMAMKKLKSEPGTDMVILGSGTIVSQLAAAGLIDTYSFIVDPVVLGKGRTLFNGVTSTFTLKQTGSRTFKNGNVLLTYVSGGAA